MESGPHPDFLLATLRVRSGLVGTASLPVRLPLSIVGADPTSDLVVAAAGVAARHGQLRLLGGIWTLVDFGSSGGSVVDGQTVRGEALLAPGSAVRIGGVAFTFAPQDRWEDSPRERRSEDRTPLLVIPRQRVPYWPSVGFVVVIAGLAVFAYFLFRNT